MREYWRNLELSKKLGYVWTVLFAILVLGTAGSIIIPVYLDYLEERAAEERKLREEAATPEEAPGEAAPDAEEGGQSLLPAARHGLALAWEAAPDGTLRVHRSALPSGGVPPTPRVG